MGRSSDGPRRRRPLWVGFGLAVAILASLNLSTAAVAQADAADLPDPTHVGVWMELRGQMGFRDLTEARLLRLSTRAAGIESWEEWGVPLTRSEADEMTTREELQDTFAQVQEAAATIDGYAGGYLENRNGTARLMLRFVARPSRQDRATLRADLGNRVRFDWTAEHSLAELQAAQDELSASLGDHIRVVSIDLVSNQVVVVGSSAAPSAARAADSAEDGHAMVRYEVGDGPSTSACQHGLPATLQVALASTHGTPRLAPTAPHRFSPGTATSTGF